MCQSANPFCSPARRPSSSSLGNALPYNPLPVATVDRLMEKTVPHVPPHLRRALFVPKHTSSVTHLPIYDVSQAYWARMRGAVFASHAYKIDLMFLTRPQGDGDADVCFFADMDPQQRLLTLETRDAAREKRAAVTVTLPAAPLERATLTIPGVGVYHVDAHLDAPAPRDGGRPPAPNSYRPCPRLAVAPVDGAGARWEVRPEDAGSLCYSVRAARADGAPSEARAVYHHAGSHVEHPRDFSEGVVLLPAADETPGDALTALALLSVLLWHIRGLKEGPKTPVEALFRKLRTKMGGGDDGQ